MPLLHVDQMSHQFGGLRAVNNYNLQIEPGQIRGLIGPNGAGKTTIFNLITGIYRPTEGDVRFDGESIVGLRPHEIGSRGLARTFQEMRMWRYLTALDHVRMARFSRLTYGLWGAFLHTPKRDREEEEVTEMGHRLLKLLGVDAFAETIVPNLPYGVQRRVEMARALATEPKILFLDEPTAGMNPDEVLKMIQVIRQIHEEFNPAIFLIEHRLRVVMELCQRIQCLVFGEVIAEGTPDEIQNDPKVIEAYLGSERVE